jgi:hypothetical protein
MTGSNRMFRSHSTARRLCLVLLLLVAAALCVPPAQSSAAPLDQVRQGAAASVGSLPEPAGSALRV